MLWLLKSPEHQQAWYWLCRTDNMYCYSRVNFIYLDQSKSKILFKMWIYLLSLQWRHNEHDGISDDQPHDSLLNCLFMRRSMKTSKLHVTGLCAGNSPVTGEFPAQRASNAEKVSIWLRHHVIVKTIQDVKSQCCSCHHKPECLIVMWLQVSGLCPWCHYTVQWLHLLNKMAHVLQTAFCMHSA